MVEPSRVPELMSRFQYLNELRVGVIKFYFAIAVGALTLVLARSLLGTLWWLLLPVFVSGIFVFYFDLRCRARSSAVAHRISEEVTRVFGESYSVSGRNHQRIDEDLAFSAILMTVNAVVFAVISGRLVYYSGLPDHVAGVLYAGIPIAVFVSQLVIHTKSWPRMSKKIGPWPDQVSPSKIDIVSGEGINT